MKKQVMKYLAILLLFSGFACTDKDKKADSSAANNSAEDTTHVESGDFVPIQATIEFKSGDGLMITADISEISESAPYLILCHQAGFSRGEYKHTSSWFNELGYNTLAIDQRSGEKVNGVENETVKRAYEQELATEYLDAEQDIRAAIGHIATLVSGPDRPIHLLGSSYSASLVLKIASDVEFEHRDQIKSVLSFSPGEYLQGIELSPMLSTIKCPVFATSSKSEIDHTKMVISKISPDLLTHFQPEVDGIHGSRGIWETTEGYETYRNAVVDFLK